MGVVFAGAEVCEPGRGADAQAGDASLVAVSSPQRSWQRPSARPDSVTTSRRSSDESVLTGLSPGSCRRTVAGGRRRGRGRAQSLRASARRRVDTGNLRPVDTDAPTAADPARELPDPAGALSPVAGPTRIATTSGVRPGPPSMARSSTLPRRRPSLSRSWWSSSCSPISISLPLNSGPHW